MVKTPYGVVVSSQKGGVGKTVVSVNLAAALKARGYSVLLIDADYDNPTVGFHLGLEKVDTGIRSVLEDRGDIRDLIVEHRSGINVLPSEITDLPMEMTERQALYLYNQIAKLRYDFVIVDMAPGPLPTEMLSVFERWDALEALILLNPEMAACMSAIRLSGLYDRHHIERKFAANRDRHRGYELGLADIEDVCGERLIGEMPEDEHVPLSVANHTPVYVLNKNCAFSKAMNSLSRHYAANIGAEPGESDTDGEEGTPDSVKGFFARVLH